MDKTLRVNLATTRYDPILKKYFPKEDGLVQCKLCGWVQKLSDSRKCEACTATNFIRVNRKTPVSPAEKGSTAQFFRPLKVCWNADVNAETGEIVRHPLDEGSRLVVNVSYGEAHKESFCRTGGRVYGWSEGRAATAQEIADCKAGKIQAKMTQPVAAEVESA